MYNQFRLIFLKNGGKIAISRNVNLKISTNESASIPAISVFNIS